MDMKPTVASTVNLIREGSLTSREWVQNSLNQIEAHADVGAWSHVDSERSLERADQLDQIRKSGRAIGALHGCPIGLKDIIEVAGMPHGCGTPLMGQISTQNAALVDALEFHGAVVIGKTETTELATMQPARTRNPLNLDYSPGGSSAGSAAAVAAGDVPLAIGSQTNGSVIRPASYCGVFGMKPSAGIIPRVGVYEQSPTLDQMGLFATSLEDLATVWDCLSVHDSRDPHSINHPRPHCVQDLATPAPIEPNFAVFQLPYQNRQKADCTAGFAELIETLDGRVEVLEVPPVLDQVIQAHRIIHLREMHAAFTALDIANRPELSEQLRALVLEGEKYTKDEYENALMIKSSVESFFSNVFEDFNAILTPSAAGEAPLFSEGITGDPIFCTIWTLAGLPCISLPILEGENQMPIGVQIVGKKADDGRLFQTAHWLMTTLFSEGTDTCSPNQ